MHRQCAIILAHYRCATRICYCALFLPLPLTKSGEEAAEITHFRQHCEVDEEGNVTRRREVSVNLDFNNLDLRPGRREALWTTTMANLQRVGLECVLDDAVHPGHCVLVPAVGVRLTKATFRDVLRAGGWVTS